MPSLHKREKSRFWVASFQDASGRWLKKSTKTENRTLAMKMAMQWEDAAKAGREGRFVESQMRKVISEIAEHATGKALDFYTCEGWLTEWVAGKGGAVAGSTLVRYRQVVGAFLGYLGNRAAMPLNAITIGDVRGFRDALAKQGLSASSVNQTIRKVLATPFLAAVRAGFIQVNPCSGVDALLDDAEIERDTFTARQVGELIAAAEGDWQGAILTGFTTGLRLRDVADMQWQALDLGAGLLKLRTQKTKAIVTIPLHPDLQAWLEKQPRGIGKAPVFPSLCGKAGSGKSGLSMAFKRIMERAGITGRILRQGIGKAGRTTTSLSFHSLRHSFTSALANAGVTPEVRQKLTGHTDAASHARYTHHEIQTLRNAVSKVPSLGGRA